MNRQVLCGLLVAAWLASGPAVIASNPSIVCILADDLGSGDVKCLNPGGKIATPNLDRLAQARTYPASSLVLNGFTKIALTISGSSS